MSTTGKSAEQRLGTLLWGLRREFLAAFAFSGVANLLLLTPTVYMLQVYDRVLVSLSELTLLAVSLIALFLFGVLGFAEWIRGRVLVRAGLRLDRMLGTRVFDASFEASLAQSGQSPARAFSDVLLVRQFLTGPSLFAFFDAPWVPIYLAVCFFLHPLLGVAAAVFACIQLFLAWLGHRHSAEPADNAARAVGDANTFLQAKLRNAETIESMGMLAGLRRRWQARQNKAIAADTRAVETSQRITAVSKFMRYTQQSLTLATGALLVIDGQLTAGAMIASNVLMARALAPIDMVVAQWRVFIAARAAYGRLQTLLDTFPPADDTQPRSRPAGSMQVRKLVATAPNRETPILKGIDLDIAAGHTVVVLGPSGSGKSTLARCLLGIWPHATGEVMLDGEPLKAWSREALGPHVGYLPQDIELFEGSIAENIARMAEPDSKEVITAAKATGLHDTILRLPRGYDTPIGEAGSLLSGGQRQRLALARALYGDPAVLVLDEPNANLDDAGELALRQTLQDLRKQGRTVVLITHRLPALQLADRVLVLRDGEVVVYGPPSVVLPSLQQQPAGMPRPTPA